MASSILLTKLFLPALRENLVRRSRLLDNLEHFLEPGYRLALISAPAGYGKTTLVSTWLHQLQERQELESPTRITWLSLEAADNDPLVFWTYVLAALQGQNLHIGDQTRSLLASSLPVASEDFLISLLNDLSQDDGFTLLVLDDFHTIRSAQIPEGLSFLLERMPPRFRLLLCTRSDPPLPLAQLRGHGQLLEVRLIDLRFSTVEAAFFLNRHMGLHLSNMAVAVLNDRAEGWAAGLQMAAVSLRDEQDIDRFITSFSGSNRYIMDYLIEEVLQRQSQEVKDFLLSTCILEALCASLCDALWGNESHAGECSTAQQLIEHLEKSNLFIVPMDDCRVWYRYHPLFADLLKKRLQQSHPGRVVELHARASAWYENAGMVDQAIEHAFLA